MGETANIALIAGKISNDIFRVFHWETHPLKDTNFPCKSELHVTPNGAQKQTHPCDVVFHYVDPYLNKRVYLHTDLKSYGKSSFRVNKIRNAMQSLAQSIDCARVSEDWRSKYQAQEDYPFEVRGLLFVCNHDGELPDRFADALNDISTQSLGLNEDSWIHVLGPRDVTALYSVAADIKLLIHDRLLSDRYRFFYPDLVLWKRMTADDVRVAATIESLRSPYFIVKHDAVSTDGPSGTAQSIRAGAIVYYRKPGSTVEEFQYLLDALLRHQLVTASQSIRVRVFAPSPSPHLKSNFLRAQERYCSEWGFEESRAQEIKAISIDTVPMNLPNYSPDIIGWDQ